MLDMDTGELRFTDTLSCFADQLSHLRGYVDFVWTFV